MKTRFQQRLLFIALTTVLVPIMFFATSERSEEGGSGRGRDKASMPSSMPATRTAPLQKDEVLVRPLQAALSSVAHEWASEDATLPSVIEVIAHNPEEFIRMIEENDRIERRQLVYRKKPTWVLVEFAKASGEEVRQLVLPGLDGKEIDVEVTSSDLSLSGMSGTFAGHVVGRPGSLVTLAFDRGREAFTVLSPEEGVFLQGHPREPGEIMVSSFDPDVYMPLGVCQPMMTSK